MDAHTPERDEGSQVRNRLHQRGLSSRSKSSSSEDSHSSPLATTKDPIHHLRQFIPKRHVLSELNTAPNSANYKLHNDLTNSPKVFPQNTGRGLTKFDQIFVRKVRYSGSNLI